MTKSMTKNKIVVLTTRIQRICRLHTQKKELLRKKTPSGVQWLRREHAERPGGGPVACRPRLRHQLSEAVAGKGEMVQATDRVNNQSLANNHTSYVHKMIVIENSIFMTFVF
jgi:hypothetical protein